MSNNWIPYNSEDKYANPLPEPGTTVWIHDAYYHGVALGFWASGWWELLSGSDDISVTHWKPLEKPAAPPA